MINNDNQIISFEEKNINFYSERNPNIVFKEDLTDDCLYDNYKNNYNFDIYNLYFEKEKTFLSFISKKDNFNIKILEISKNSNSNQNIVVTLKDHKDKVLTVKHYFNFNTKKDYLLSTDCKGNLLLYEIISINEYKLKHRIDSKSVRNKRYICKTVNQMSFFPGMRNKIGFGCMYNKPYHFNNPINNFGMGGIDMFGGNKFGMFDDMNFGFQEPTFVIDYIDCTLLFFNFNNNYIFILYRESSSLAIFDLETLESKGRVYDQNSINSMVQWFNSSEKINYLILSGYNKIEIMNPFEEKNKIKHVFKDNDNLKGGNYAYFILYNFRDNYDYLLSYTRYIINIINLNTKNINYSIKMKYNINSVLCWNKKYLIASQGENYGNSKISKLAIIHIDSKKIINHLSENNNSFKGVIKKIIFCNDDFSLFINDSENKIKLWEIKNIK